jgi:peroxiredoxin
MAQLRHDYPKFSALKSEILVVVPNGPKMIERYVKNHATPYPILSDKGSRVAEQYAIGRIDAVVFTALMPSVFLIDQTGRIIYTNYLNSYIKEPDNHEPLAMLANRVI